MKHVGISFGVVAAVLMAAPFFVLHMAACNLHVAAVELYRSDHRHSGKFAWSYSYCKFVGSPLR